MSGLLSDWGMSVTTASGADALIEMRAGVTDGRPFAMAILDQFMPEMDGLELKAAQ